MPGKNIILKPGQVLFRAGDQSNGMFLVRRGDLRVYLEQDGKEVFLATVTKAGMIGEMALFDKKPRSASVRAMTEVEVTQITNTDFMRLLKQIPNWFVALMGTLSGRLRDTNTKLQKLEGEIKPRPFQKTLRMLHVLSLLWFKEGAKEGKVWQIDKKIALEAVREILGQEAETLDDLIKALVQHSLITLEKNTYNAVVLSMATRTSLKPLIDFVADWISRNPDHPHMPEAAIEILVALEEAGKESAYESFNVSFEELLLLGRRADMENVEIWSRMLPLFRNVGDSVKLIKTSSGELGFRAEKKKVQKSLQHHKILADFYARNLG